eukprot:758348-Hanusia_phi.AAC.2
MGHGCELKRGGRQEERRMAAGELEVEEELGDYRNGTRRGGEEERREIDLCLACPGVEHATLLSAVSPIPTSCPTPAPPPRPLPLPSSSSLPPAAPAPAGDAPPPSTPPASSAACLQAPSCPPPLPF